jgi:hypothetical protein
MPKSSSNAEAATSKPAEGPDPYNLESLAVRQDFAETIGVKKVLMTVKVDKPDKQDFVRIHPDPAYRCTLVCIELKGDRETYIVRPEIAPELAGETTIKKIFTWVNRQGVVGLWPITVPNPEGKANEWHRSALEAAERGMKSWIRVTSNMSLGAYEVAEAPSLKLEPKWPEQSLQELVRIAFRDKLIDSVDHPVVRRLRGVD